VDVYAERERAFQAAADTADRTSLRISHARIAVFLAGAAAVVLLWDAGRAWKPAVAAAGATAAFLALVVWHGRVDDQQQWSEALARVNREQRGRVRRDWAVVPHLDVPAPDEHHPYVADLDLFGRASLFDLLAAVATPRGRAVLAAWLLQPAAADVIISRQTAVSELAPLLDFRQRIHARARLSNTDAKALERFLEWAEEPPWLVARPWLLWTARSLAALTMTLAAGSALGLLAASWWAFPLLAGMALWLAVLRRIERTFGRAFARQDAPRQDARMFGLICATPFRAPRLADARRALMADGLSADVCLRRLQRLMDLADTRLVPLFHLLVNALMLWDFHVVAAVERWQVTAGHRARLWYDVLGELEALSALAGLRHDNADWVFPELTAAEPPVLEARDLAHPLIARGVRVANDVQLGPPGTFLFVTGSNMSGKSTLLRAIGVNVVLAQAGGPVCASAMRLPPLPVYTSMRVQDSLEEGVSYFMAGLKRLKDVIDASRRLSAAGDRAQLYLLDEILQGTNTAERQIAVRIVVRHLLAARALGAITSHDLTLVEPADLARAAVAVHFTEAVGETPEAVLSFDYRLRPGVATSRNAIKLMRLVGLE
jgi:hypothetical protein